MKTLQEFIELCVPTIKKSEAEAQAAQADFTILEWLDVYEACCKTVFSSRRPFGRIPQCHNMKTIALKKAVEKATTREDWKNILRRTRSGAHHTLAHNMLRELARAG